MGRTASMSFPIKTGPHTPAQFAQRFELGVHEGTDVFAPAGAELVAIEPGVVRQSSNPKGGHVVYLKTDEGTQYYYAHLDAFSYPLMPGETRRVDTGDSLGYVGTSGNARGKAPHLHLEVKLANGQKVDPFPLLSKLAKTEEQRIVAPRAPAAVASKKKKRRQSAPASPLKTRHPAPADGWGTAVVVFGLAYLVGSRRHG